MLLRGGVFQQPRRRRTDTTVHYNSGTLCPMTANAGKCASVQPGRTGMSFSRGEASCDRSECVIPFLWLKISPEPKSTPEFASPLRMGYMMEIGLASEPIAHPFHSGTSHGRLGNSQISGSRSSPEMPSRRTDYGADGGTRARDARHPA